MTGLSLVKSFETMNNLDKIFTIADLLESAGFTIEYRRRSQGHKNIENFIYVKDGVDYVFCVIHKIKENEFLYTLMDYRTYMVHIKPNPDIIINYMMRQMGDYKIVLRDKEHKNTPIHRLAIDCEGKQINHKSHNACLNIGEYLIACTNAENCKDKAFYSKIADDKKSFSAPTSILGDKDKILLLGKGFQIKGGRLQSPEYKSLDDMYTALNEFETRYLGKFRYNPLIDFTDTWYALVIQKMFGDISDTDLYEYNRQYMLSNHSDIAEYYQLAI